MFCSAVVSTPQTNPLQFLLHPYGARAGQEDQESGLFVSVKTDTSQHILDHIPGYKMMVATQTRCLHWLGNLEKKTEGHNAFRHTSSFRLKSVQFIRSDVIAVTVHWSPISLSISLTLKYYSCFFAAHPYIYTCTHTNFAWPSARQCIVPTLSNQML